MAGEPILVVDDNATNSKLLAVVLRAEGYQVRVAADGHELCATLADFHPRLIFMDIQLPGLDGLELTRRLRANPATRDIVIVAVSAYAMKSDMEQALANGCDGYLAKPVDTRALPGIVADYLARAQARGA
jgi:two-component system, cell cycle response regulator DivK